MRRPAARPRRQAGRARRRRRRARPRSEGSSSSPPRLRVLRLRRRGAGKSSYPRPMASEAELVRRAQRGDEAAFASLVAAHERALYTLAARMLGSADDARDAVQEALLRAWLALPRFRGDAQLSTWLYRICLNAVHDQLARRRPTT